MWKKLNSVQFSFNNQNYNNWATSWQNQQSGKCTQQIQYSYQLGHLPSLIRVFAVHIDTHWVLSYLLSIQRRLWSDWADARADLSLCWAHMPLCRFCQVSSVGENINRSTTRLVYIKLFNKNNQSVWLSGWWFICTGYVMTTTHFHLSRAMRKCVLCHMRTTKAQIRLRICAVWSAPLLFAA